jgi:hypothetical protein
MMTEPTAPEKPERVWRVVVSLLISLIVGSTALVYWVMGMRILWEFATRQFDRPVMAIGPVGFLGWSIFMALFVGSPLLLASCAASKRPIAIKAFVLAYLAIGLVVLNVLLLLVIVFVRSIEFAG